MTILNELQNIRNCLCALSSVNADVVSPVSDNVRTIPKGDYTINPDASTMPLEITPCNNAWLVLENMARKLDELAKLADTPLFNFVTTITLFAVFLLNPQLGIVFSISSGEAASLWSTLSSIAQSGGASVFTSYASRLRSPSDDTVRCMANALVNGDGVADKVALAKEVALTDNDPLFASLVSIMLFENEIKAAFNGVVDAEITAYYGESTITDIDCSCIQETPSGLRLGGTTSRQPYDTVQQRLLVAGEELFFGRLYTTSMYDLGTLAHVEFDVVRLSTGLKENVTFQHVALTNYTLGGSQPMLLTDALDNTVLNVPAGTIPPLGTWGGVNRIRIIGLDDTNFAVSWRIFADA